MECPHPSTAHLFFPDCFKVAVNSSLYAMALYTHTKKPWLSFLYTCLAVLLCVYFHYYIFHVYYTPLVIHC